MNFEDLQKIWQEHGAGQKVVVNADLLNEVRRNEFSFRAMIFWRDVREVGVALGLTVWFGNKGWHYHDWTIYLLGLACLSVAIFFLADRWAQRKRKPVVNDSLRNCIMDSLDQVNHQIWLLRNVLWWYLLPLAAPIVIFFLCSPILPPGGAADKAACLGLMLGVFVFVYWLNQIAVRKRLEPRRRELEALKANLDA